MSHDAELRHLIARLAQDHDLPVTRHGHLIGHRRQKPLLAILAETSTPSSGSAAGRGTVGPRIAFDPTASELHATIHARIRDWALTAHVPRGPYFVTGDQLDWTDTAQLLLAWHSATSDTDPLTWIPTLASYIELITDLVIDPPKRITLDAPCPRCGNRWAILGGRDSSRVDALQITLRDPAPASSTDCRACGTRWPGLDGADALKEEFHHLAHLEHALHCADMHEHSAPIGPFKALLTLAPGISIPTLQTSTTAEAVAA